MLVWLYHGLRWTWADPTGYNVVSGIGSDLGELAILGAALAWLRRHNCHVRRCWRLGWHPHPDHGHLVCRAHHPDCECVTAAGLDLDRRKP
jgi:hypothetical protein